VTPTKQFFKGELGFIQKPNMVLESIYPHTNLNSYGYQRVYWEKSSSHIENRCI